MNRIDLYLKSLEKAFAATGEIAPWPIHVSIPSIYGGDYEAADLFSKFKEISREDQPPKIISKLFDGPSVAKALLMDLIPGMKVARPSISVEERVLFTDGILEAIEEMQAGDIFCLDGTNRILDSYEVKKLFKQTPWIWLKTQKDKKTLGHSFYKASASVKSLIWSLYFYGWDDVGYEIHGPYKIGAEDGSKYQLVITDYFNLKPTLLWPKLDTFPYRTVQLLALYPENAELSVDMFIHFFNKGDLLEMTEGVYFEANGVPLRTIEAAESLSTEILERVSVQHKTIQAMSKEHIIKKYIESRYYAFRRWRWYFGEDWRPPQKVFDRIKEWGIIDIPAGGGPSWEELKKAFDPRTDYVPGPDS
jgi:hypothetical protein